MRGLSIHVCARGLIYMFAHVVLYTCLRTCSYMQWSSFRGQDESETLATLPLSLRRDVLDHLLGDILRGSVYFENISRGCLNSLV